MRNKSTQRAYRPMYLSLGGSGGGGEGGGGAPCSPCIKVLNMDKICKNGGGGVRGLVK